MIDRSKKATFNFCGISFKAFNMAMIGKQTWEMMNSSDPLITKFFKAKYVPQRDYFGAYIEHNLGYVSGVHGVLNRW